LCHQYRPLLLGLPSELLLAIFSRLPAHSLPLLHNTCRKFRDLKADLLGILLRKWTVTGRLQNWKVCVYCLCLLPRADFPWHSTSHKDKSSQICLRHLKTTYLCQHESCDLRQFASESQYTLLRDALKNKWLHCQGPSTANLTRSFRSGTIDELSVLVGNDPCTASTPPSSEDREIEPRSWRLFWVWVLSPVEAPLSGADSQYFFPSTLASSQRVQGILLSARRLLASRKWRKLERSPLAEMIWTKVVYLPHISSIAMSEPFDFLI